MLNILNKIEFKNVEYNSIDFKLGLILRYQILRLPLQLNYDYDDLNEEKDQVHFVASIEHEIIGTIIFKKLNHNTIKMRQVAISEPYQSKGIGAEFVKFTEHWALQNHFIDIELNARKTAINFYLKLYYKIEGDEFLENGIPHFKMVKHLKLD